MQQNHFLCKPKNYPHHKRMVNIIPTRN
uniref:Uncharacterized protein n=1 Tax=Rhizophora mucronata TaxID=61149 RepID=A0A2P2PHJ1_RHIMU